MATVTLYEYAGETRHELGVSDNWDQVGEPVEYDPSEMHWVEALLELHHLDNYYWCYNYVIIDGRAKYRAEVKGVSET